jgi:hypothetical protein
VNSHGEEIAALNGKVERKVMPGRMSNRTNQTRSAGR